MLTIDRSASQPAARSRSKQKQISQMQAASKLIKISSMHVSFTQRSSRTHAQAQAKHRNSQNGNK